MLSLYVIEGSNRIQPCIINGNSSSYRSVQVQNLTAHCKSFCCLISWGHWGKKNRRAPLTNKVLTCKRQYFEP